MVAAGGVVDVQLVDGGLVVRDHGPGFPRTTCRTSSTGSTARDDARGTPGSGLGLAIVRQATEAGGGGVVAANAPTGAPSCACASRATARSSVP